jgi:sRNA-binding protein
MNTFKKFAFTLVAAMAISTAMANTAVEDRHLTGVHSHTGYAAQDRNAGDLPAVNDRHAATAAKALHDGKTAKQQQPIAKKAKAGKKNKACTNKNKKKKPARKSRTTADKSVKIVTKSHSHQ